MSIDASRDLWSLLHEAVDEGAFGCALVSTQQGLPVAAAGASSHLVDSLAAICGIFDDVVRRATHDLDVDVVDEVTLRDADRARIVVRPLGETEDLRMFLVVEVPSGRTWRRVTNRLCRSLPPLLDARAPVRIA